MTGIFNMRPPKPKLSLIWDVDILFKYFEQQGGRGGGGNCLLSDVTLAQKLIICLGLTDSVQLEHSVLIIWF